MSIIYPTISILYNALQRDYIDEDIDICNTNKIDLDTIDDISMFDLKKFEDNKTLFITMAIDPRCKNFEYEGAILKCQDYLRLKYNQIKIRFLYIISTFFTHSSSKKSPDFCHSPKDLGSSSNKATLDLFRLFISIVFIAVQQNTIHKNEDDQYFIMEIIEPLDNSL
ncbi:hypothetical protein C2G38_2170507 [Gigaspora rosea]|uniref:Uncharacterized protein n=1 Tax=Gigaspora rosea TaxID=44941 RepID=A0A397VRQ1_9GLOM|nr:hypothetical protein C2G38_2170507 [Gigaspora rosea]